jgi:TPR repeat protein
MTKSIITDAFDRMPEDASEAEWREFFILVESIAFNGNFETQPEARITMAILYENGMGVLKDIEKAIDWYTNAAEVGLVEAKYLLGELYDNYCYGNENYKQKAKKWTEKAAKKGHVQAQYKLSYIYTYGHGVHKDPKQAIKWCRKSAEQGYVSAQLGLGHQYSYGANLSKDLFKAAEWYTKAAKQGSTEAQCSLGELYEGGWGVNQNFPLAYSLFNVAAINRCDEAARLRSKLEEKMSDDQITEAKLLEPIWQSNKV